VRGSGKSGQRNLPILSERELGGKCLLRGH
jgi:hypothetical protein